MPEIKESKKDKILIVDDDKKLLEEIKVYLEHKGYSPTTAIDGMEGLVAYMKEPFDLVITDMRMPKLGGKEMVRKIRMKNSSIPIIVITAYGNIHEGIKAIKEV